MKLRFSVFAAALALAGVATAADNASQTPSLRGAEEDFDSAHRHLVAGDAIAGSYIVQFRDDVPDVPGLLRALDMRTNGNLGPPAHVYQHSIKGFAARGISTALAKQLSDMDEVVSVTQDTIITIDAPPPDKGPNRGGDDDGGSPPPQETPWGISRVGGGGDCSPSGVAWVLDSGIDVDHEDLIVDAGRGFSAFTRGKDAGVDDGNGHGTHVAGTIAAVNNEIGVIGVCPGATVIPVKVLGARGSGSVSGVIAGVDFVAANGSTGDVANMSLGGGISTALDNAVLAASENVKFTLAAGNESQNASNSSPARVNGHNIYTISAMDRYDNFASFSNFGNPPVDYCAPGVGVLSTLPGNAYGAYSGTSMAAPHAAGVLLRSNGRTDGTVNGDPDGNADPIIVV